jgi:hypothetical protein
MARRIHRVRRAAQLLLFALPLVVASSACTLIDSFDGFTGATDAGAGDTSAMPDSRNGADHDSAAPPLDASSESNDSPSQVGDGSSEADAGFSEADAGLAEADASGGCGITCPSPSYCSGGQCLFKCPDGLNFTVSVVSTAVANGTYQFLSNVSLALDAPNGGVAGTGLDQFAYIGAGQQWTVTGVGGGAYKILAQNGLAVTGQGRATQLNLEPFTGSAQQLFVFVQNGSSWNIVNMVDCLALDDSGGGIRKAVVGWAFSPTSKNQSWTLTPLADVTGPVANGTYKITDTSSKYLIDDYNGGGPGTIPDLQAYAGPNQMWTITRVSGVQYSIIAASGAALTVSSTPNITIAALSSYTGADSQLFIIWPSGNGSSYGLVNVGSLLCVDDHGGGGLGVQLQQWSWANNSHQQWLITP